MGGLIYHERWYAGRVLLAVLAMVWALVRPRGGCVDGSDVELSKSIILLLFGGVLVTGFVGALIPEEGRGGRRGRFSGEFIAPLVGAMWYFATLTEIPIPEALLGLVIAVRRWPFLAGPALSLPRASP